MRLIPSELLAFRLLLRPSPPTGPDTRGATKVALSGGFSAGSMATNNGNFGVQMNQGIVKGTIIARNVGDGISSTGLRINIQDCQINDNGGFGIDFTSAGGAIGNNVIRGNDAGAIDGSATETAGNYCSGSGCP